MGYQKAEEILPAEVIELIQRYVDGQAIYIPRIPGKRQKWGRGTKIQKELQIRNQRIFSDYVRGTQVSELASRYFLSVKSIQRIIRTQKE